jgi:hypothetical protein
LRNRPTGSRNVGSRTSECCELALRLTTSSAKNCLRPCRTAHKTTVLTIRLFLHVNDVIEPLPSTTEEARTRTHRLMRAIYEAGNWDGLSHSKSSKWHSVGQSKGNESAASQSNDWRTRLPASTSAVAVKVKVKVKVAHLATAAADDAGENCLQKEGAAWASSMQPLAIARHSWILRRNMIGCYFSGFIWLKMRTS